MLMRDEVGRKKGSLVHMAFAREYHCILPITLSEYQLPAKSLTESISTNFAMHWAFESSL